MHIKYYYEKGVNWLYQTVKEINATKQRRIPTKLFCGCMALLFYSVF